MVKVGIVALSEPGHINATIRLRNELLELDCDVRFVTDKFHHGEEELYTRRGLPVARAFPSKNGGLHIPAFSPDVVLVESVLIIEAIKFWDAGVPVVKMSSTFSQRYDPSLPPITSDMRPIAGADQSGAHAELVAQAWNIEHARVNPWQRPTWGKECIDFATSRGFPVAWLDKRSAVDITFKLPELNLAPAELDFTRSDEDLFYAGPCVELSREEPRLRVPSGRPIVYCAFGTQSHRYVDLTRRMRLVMDAARLLPELQFVFAGNYEEAGEPPPNAMVVREAPQLSILRRASLFVSHGGLNSVKEALCLGVPPLVLPFDMDQPGNAARLEHHGCGIQASWTLTASELAAAIRSGLVDEELKSRVLAMQSVLLKSLDERRAAKAFKQAWDYSRRFRKRRASRAVWVMV